MLNSKAIAFIIINSLEAVFIIVGNSLAIFVFWTQISQQKRTCLLLLNLAVADLLVGIAEPMVLVTEKLPRMKSGGEQIGHITNPSSALQLLASSTSVFFLALISLERAYAVIRPMRHRITNIRVYILAITIVWVVGLFMAGLSVSSIYEAAVDEGIVLGTVHVFLLISLLVICVSYLKIRTRLRHTPAEIASKSGRSTERNLRVSRTVFLVIAVSLVFWVPAFVMYTVQGFCQKCFNQSVFSVVNAFHLANSMVNPFVYTFRMPLFKDALKRLWRKRRQNFEIRPIRSSRNRMALRSVASITTSNWTDVIHAADMPWAQRKESNGD